MLTSDIQKYVALYSSGMSIKDIPKLNNSTYNTFLLANTDIRIINREKSYKHILGLKKIEHFVKDTKNSKSKYFYMIPIQTPSGTFTGFIFRNMFYKSYATVNRELKKTSKIPMMYGFYKDFLNYGEEDLGMPIVVCEGSKDCIALKTIYPYVVSNNTSGLGINANILRNLTSKFVLAYDRDETGIAKTLQDQKRLQGLGAFVATLSLPDGVKDCADCLIKREDYSTLKTNLMKKIDYLRKN